MEKGKTPAQVVLAWHIQRGTVPLVKTSKVERLAENISVFDISLTEEEVNMIDSLHKGHHVFDPKAWSGSFGNIPYFD